MKELNFGPSEYRSYNSRYEPDPEPDMIIKIPEQGELEPLPDYVLKDFLDTKEATAQQGVLMPEKPEGGRFVLRLDIKSGYKWHAVVFPLRCDFQGCCDLEKRIIMPWIDQRGEWVAMYYRKWIESMPRNDECYSGPFKLNDYCKRKILEAFDVSEETIGLYSDGLGKKLLLEDVPQITPAQLNKMAPSHYVWSGFMRGSWLPGDAD